MQIVSRAQWGARYADGSADAPIPSEWWLHHSAGLMPDVEWVDADLDGVDDDEERVMRALEQTGQDRFGAGMSYTWLVPPSGRAYVGHSMHRRGAHTGGRNDRSRAICLIGDYGVARITDAQLTTVAEIMVAEHRAGRARTHRLNGGYRDLTATECPGNFAYQAIPLINRRADRFWTQEDDMPTPQEIWDYVIDDPYVWQGGEQAAPKPAKVLLSYASKHAANALEQAAAARAELAALKAALPAMVAEEIRTALAQGLVDVDITVRDKTEEPS